MTEKKELAKAIEKLFHLKSECHLQMVEDLGISDISLKQLNNIKHFKGENGITASQLAKDLNITKPTVTEMVKHFVKLGFVYKEDCPTDKRVHYLKLTEKGQKIANIGELTTNYLAERVSLKLDKRDLKTIIEILNKIE